MANPEHVESGDTVPDWYLNLLQGELGSPDEVKGFGVWPNEARYFLESLDFDEEMWDEILQRQGHSHEIRAQIIIARGNQPRLDYLIRIRLRLEDKTLDRSRRWSNDSDLDLLFTPEENRRRGLQ